MGYDTADVPKTCGEFLSFLEAWIARQDAAPEAVQVFGGWDYTVYDATTYTAELARLILEEAIRQQQAAGEALSFSDPMLLDALTRVRQVGQALARVEPPSASMSAGEWRTNQPALFVHSDPNPWGRMADWGVSLRLHPEQPFTLPVMLQVTMEDAVQADETFSILMGDKVAPRKEFIEQNAKYVVNLDV